MKTAEERIKEIICEGHLNNNDGWMKLVEIAYYMGREDKACENAYYINGYIKRMRERANECRYSKMANRIIDDPILSKTGSLEYIYDEDFSRDITNEFGSDDTKL